MDCLVAELCLNSCFLYIVLVTMLHTAVETAVSRMHILLHTGRVPTSLALLFWQFPHLLAEFLVVADGVFSLYGLEHADELFISNELFISTHPHPIPHL